MATQLLSSAALRHFKLNVFEHVVYSQGISCCQAHPVYQLYWFDLTQLCDATKLNCFLYSFLKQLVLLPFSGYINDLETGSWDGEGGSLQG